MLPLAAALRGAREHLPQSETADAAVHLVLGDIDPDDNALILCHHPLPSLPCTGSKPLQLFGLRKTTGAVPRSDTGFIAFGALRAQFQRRAVLREPPVRTFCQILRTQGALRAIVTTREAGSDGRDHAAACPWDAPTNGMAADVKSQRPDTPMLVLRSRRR